MTGPAAIPTPSRTAVGITGDAVWRSSFRAMASPVRVQLGLDTPLPHRLHEQVRDLFAEVERQCTRFDPASDLMRANAAGDDWCTVGEYCFAAIDAAQRAHHLTSGLFDPRVLTTLAGLGYTQSWTSGGPDAGTLSGPAPELGTPWTPDLDGDALAVRLGPAPVDLGGIGKGLALRWAAQTLDDAGCRTFLVEAGGDCVARGDGPDGDGWRLGVEDPSGGDGPVAVVSVHDGAVATSSTRLRRWQVGGTDVHHLIDPRTGRPGHGALACVTVVAADPALAEVWSKSLFLHGREIADFAAEHDIAALWVSNSGQVASSPALADHLVWVRS